MYIRASALKGTLQSLSFLARDVRQVDLGLLGPKPPGPVDHILQLFEGHEDQNSRGL